MSYALSRRIAKIMHTDVVYAMPDDESLKMAVAAETAASFSKMPAKYRKVVLAAEAERKKTNTKQASKEQRDSIAAVEKEMASQTKTAKRPAAKRVAKKKA